MDVSWKEAIRAEMGQQTFVGGLGGRAGVRVRFGRVATHGSRVRNVLSMATIGWAMGLPELAAVAASGPPRSGIRQR